MNHSIKNCGLGLGSAVLLVLAGCSHEDRPAKQAASSPTFESNVESSPSYGAGQSSTTAQPGTGSAGQTGSSTSGSVSGSSPESPSAAGSMPGMEHGSDQPGQGSTGVTGQGSTGATPSAEAASTATSEQDLCDSLTRDAKLHVEDVQGGVALFLKPRVGTALSVVRQRAQQVEQRMDQSASSSSPSGGSCELFATARSGASVSIAEAPDSVRILITTTDPNHVQSIRKQVRSFINASDQQRGGSGSGSGTRGGGSGTHGGGSGNGSGTQGGGSSSGSGP